MDAVIRAWPAEAAADPGFRALPPEAPLDMPVQSLFARRERKGPPASAPRSAFLRRVVVFGSAVALTALGALEMHRVLKVAGLTALEVVLLVLFVTLFAWIALSFISGLAGFVSLVFGGGRALGVSHDAPLPDLRHRTALLMPTYNEAPARVMAGLQAVYESLRETGRLDHFDVFILSDTTDPDIWVAEEAAFLALRERVGGGERIFYRRRLKNVERKAGNIADWVKRFGAAYEQMIVLDADSVMTGESLVRLAGAMERHPDVGLIQTLPIIVNRNTLFARLQQFAGRVYGPLIAHGIAWWHGTEGNYWGHNAIIRTRAFAAEAGLPHLPGRKPFGGHILSHDFVEAALMRRGGWAVRMVPALRGSYEESPPSLIDVSARDRRWAQGNLQHLAVLPARGLHWVSRVHLLMGIGAYIASPLWLLFLVTGMLASLQAAFIRPEYFTSEFSLYPRWPAQDPVRAAWVFVGTMGLLVVPKLLSYVALLLDPECRRGCGGAIRAFLSVVLETLISGLIAPIMMVIQSITVGEILTGRDAGWRPQRRDDGSIPFGQIVRRHAGHTAFGLFLAWASYAVSWALFLWMTPVIAGLLLSIPISALTAKRSLGVALRRLGLLLIPEERAPPPVLQRANELQGELSAGAGEPPDAARALAADERLLAAHRAMLPPKRPRRRGEIEVDLVTGLVKIEEAESFEAALADLNERERAAVLADARGLDRLMALARAPQPGTLAPAAE